jgi:hypothetical protein
MTTMDANRKAADARYDASDKGRARDRRYRASHLAGHAEYMSHWRCTTKGILTEERWSQKRRLNRD